jgi:hypothetical protein
MYHVLVLSLLLDRCARIIKMFHFYPLTPTHMLDEFRRGICNLLHFVFDTGQNISSVFFHIVSRSRENLWKVVLCDIKVCYHPVKLLVSLMKGNFATIVIDECVWIGPEKQDYQLAEPKSRYKFICHVRDFLMSYYFFAVRNFFLKICSS